MADLEILEALVSFFCPTSEAASTCREFIQNHSQVLPPIGPLFYFLLFPAVFTILFVLLLMDNVGIAKNRSPGIKVLLGITAFIFIIISGWYPVMLVLSEFWYIIIILLGFVWFVTGHRDKKEGGGGGGGGKGAMGALGSLSGGITEDAGRILKSKYWSRETTIIEGQIDEQLRLAQFAVHNRKSDSHFTQTIQTIEGEINRLLVEYGKIMEVKENKEAERKMRENKMKMLHDILAGKKIFD